jgi:hypothetical protein
MPNINLRDKRNRDATISAEPVTEIATVRYVDANGATPKLHHVLKSTSEHTLEQLTEAAGGDDQLTHYLVSEDGDTDIERVGMFLKGTNRVYVNGDGETVFRIDQTEVIRGPDGVEKERRPRKQQMPNVETEFPVSWTGRLVKKDDAIRRFVFSSKLQIVHINGLTYDFLYAMAKELAEADSLMLLGGGQSGKDPLVFRRGATPHRGFLEGRIDGDKYVLVLHLSKLELKRPALQPAAAQIVVVSETQAAASAAKPAEPTVVPSDGPADIPVLVPVEMPTADRAPPLAASPTPTHKPSVAEVLAATAHTPTPGPAPKKQTAAAIKTSKRTKTAADIEARSDAPSGGSTTSPSASVKPPAKPRARKAKSEASQPKS